MNKQLHTLMQKEMTRKEFLATLGFGLASIFGFSTIIRLLLNDSTKQKQRGSASSMGFGSGAYGR